ncbi:GNAT family N-acetyltransferase [Halocatena salina]|uniref:GNAT family N-acetyltransferase n=1 Tax=Halocatena salina TaxID=2934340 RepID=A0A8U0A6C9_9EURY|nr:GNAT family protein [Halocatena salina]UPM44632.1 GNAT family N-acetyltransferase [Halocatena salina]
MNSLRLRSATVADLLGVREWIDTPSALLQWAGPVFSYPLDEPQVRAHLAGTGQPSPTRRAFAAVDETGLVVGYLELDRIDSENRTASVSRVIVAPDARGEGYGAEMVRHVVTFGFDDLHLHRIGLRVFTFNDAALACYERVGFTHEGTLRDARHHDGEYWSLVQMSILDDEWEEVD